MRWGRRSLLATSSLVAMAASAPVLAQGVVTNPVPVNGVFTTTPGVTGVVLTGESFTGTILNAAPVTLGQYKVGIYTGIAVGTKSFNGAIINAGNIEVATNYPTNKHAFGIAVGAGAGGVFNGSVTNSGFITSREGYSIGHYIPPGLQGTVELADIAVRETVTGSIINTATGVIILPFGRVNSIGIAVDAPILGRIINAGYIFAGFGIDTGTGIAVRAPIMGGITNSGTLISTHIDIRVLAPLPRGITNSGFIGGKIFAPTDTAITVVGPIAGGISNTGIIAGAAEGNGIAFGTGTAFDLGAASAATVIRQSAGSIFGGIRFSSHADELLISGGAVGGGFVAPAGSAASIGLSGGVLAIGAAEFSNTPGFIGGDPLLGVQNLAALRQSGGMVVLDVVNSTNAAEVPNVRAGVITLTSVAAALTNFSAVNAINAPSFAPGASITFSNIIEASGTLTSTAPLSVPVFDLFSTAVSGRLVADGKNGLDLVLTNNGSMALTPGVDNGFAFTGTFTNPGGVLLPGISVTNGARVTGAIINAGALIASGILLAQASLAGSIVNSGVINPLPGANIQAAIQVTGLVSGTGSQPGGITNSGVILKQDSFSSAAVIQPGVPLVSLASGSLGIGIEVHPSPSFTGNLINSGVIHSYVAGILIDGGAAIGGITNTGATYTYGGITFNTLDQFIAGTPTAAFPEGVAVGIRVGSGPLAGGIVNAGSILASVNATNFLADAIGVGVLGSIGDGLGLNTGDLTGINTANRQTLTGDIRNSGTITVRAVTSGTFGLPVAVGIDVAATGLFTGRIINSGVITATATGTNAPTTAAEINQAIADNGGVVNPVVANLLAANIQGRAVGIEIGGTAFNAGLGGAFVGGVTNAGTISASGTGFSNAAPTSGIGIEARVAVEGGITNTGTITGSTAAIATSGGTVVTEAGGVLMGSVLGTASDVLNLTGGAIVLAPGQKIAGFGSFNDTGGTLVLQATPTQAPSVSAGAISLKGPVLVALQGPPQAFFGGVSFRDVFTSGTPISGSFTDARASVGLFAVTLTPDAATANALDVTLRLAPGLTAGDLGESVRFGLQAPEILADTVRHRLILGSDYDGGGVSASGLSDSATRVGGDPGPRAGEGVWARAYGARDEGGNVFNEEKIGLIAGADAAVSEAVRLGLAVNYAHNTARFIDAAKTNVESYQAMGYGSWEGGPWYASGLASVGLNSFDTTRNLASFGLAGTATSHPRGESWSGYGEAGYHVMGVPWAHLTPYAGLGYVGTHLDGFSESGGLGALQVNAATGSSLESQLGVRVSTRIGGLVPELRAAWGHEFLDAAPTITGTLETVPGSGFSAAGANFGRDSALIGAGVTHEVSETVRIFVDYDGRLTVGFSEHVVSAGVRVRF